MNSEFKLTPVEWEIMENIWNMGGKPSTREVMEFAYTNGEKAYTTIQTIMNILVKKGLLTAEKIGLVNFYQPTLSRDEIVKSEMKQMVSRIFNGSIPALANFLLNSNEVGLDEIQAIKKLLNEKETELKGNQE
ncbi:BlaI/MecI/CopY family transcriptional regulator [candidate division KSB1 bacterium]|nr:BlaI/MecI/CopY family transcriptional regulator [candidate division KSB1 bacterium]